MERLDVMISQENGVIDFSNFEELKGMLSEYLDEYRGASFTEESKGFAKAAVTDLRRLKRDVNDRKLQVKKMYMQPYEEFEAKTKELLALIDEPILLIDSQVKEFERKRVEERKAEIGKLYSEKAGELAEYAPLSRIYSSKWENASTSMKKVGEEMEQAFLGVRMDVESLKLMRVEPDIIDYALGQYKAGHTAVESMRRANEFAELAERRRKSEEAAMEAAPQPGQLPIQQELDLEAGFGLAFETPVAKAATYRVVASKEKLDMLEGYMYSFGISFERVG